MKPETIIRNVKNYRLNEHILKIALHSQCLLLKGYKIKTYKLDIYELTSYVNNM